MSIDIFCDRLLRGSRSLLILIMVCMDVAAACDQPLRRPCDLAVSANGMSVFTANRDSGTVSVVDTSTQTIQAEIAIGGKPVGIAMPAENCLLVIDSERHQIVQLEMKDSVWSVLRRLSVAEHPANILFDAQQDRCYVASLWSQTISAFSFAPESRELKPIGELQLPFPPREMCMLAESDSLVVAGSFAARIAIVDTKLPLRLVSSRALLGHNIRGMAITKSKELLLTRQELSPLAHATRDDVHWGNMISNQLVAIPGEKLLEETDLEPHCLVTQLGEPGNAAGDPGAIAIAEDGKVYVLLSGTNEVAVADSTNATSFRRFQAGIRPVASAVQAGKLYTTNIYSDSISIAQTDANSKAVQLSLGETRALTKSEQGEVLFHDSRLSLDGWMSCSSCHTDGHTNEQLNDNLSDQSFGSPKLVLTLLGVADTAPWAWNGTVETLQQQVVNSVESTMQGRSIKDEQVDAIVAFLKTLQVPQLAAPQPHSDALVLEGKRLFNAHNCFNCHTPPAFTSKMSFSIDKSLAGELNPPSLLGIRWRHKLFHDSRADSIEDIFRRYNHQLDEPLSTEEIQALAAYLRSLDSGIKYPAK